MGAQLAWHRAGVTDSHVPLRGRLRRDVVVAADLLHPPSLHPKLLAPALGIDLRQTGIQTLLEFAGQAGLWHAGHTDNVGTISRQALHFSRSFQARPLCTGITAALHHLLTNGIGGKAQ